jgi:hypothetical protein
MIMKVSTHASVPAALTAAAMPTVPAMRATRVVSWAAALALAPLAALAQTTASVPTQPAQPQQGGEVIRWEKSFPAIAAGKWTGPRLPDGQPDVQGSWANTIANQNNWTDPQGGEPGARPPKTTRAERAPSRVSDPADGQVPFQPWARTLQQEYYTNFRNPVKPEYIEPFARCAPGGVPKSFIWHGYEIRQYPGYVLFLFNSGTRIVHLDGKPHLPASVKLWNADSRGRWEGNTLIVDVTNNNARARLGRSGEFFSDNVHIEERYIFAEGGQRYNYVATITDPTVYTRPWTTTIPSRRWTVKDEPDGWHYEAELANLPGKPPLAEHYERVCVENNGGFGNVAVSSSAK